MREKQKVFAIVDPEKYLLDQNSLVKKPRCFCFFGVEDIIINHTQLLIDLEDGLHINTTTNGEKNMRNRVYSVQTVSLSEFLVVKLNDLDQMKKENPSIAQRFFKRQMQQTKMILSFHLHALKTYGSQA